MAVSPWGKNAACIKSHRLGVLINIRVRFGLGMTVSYLRTLCPLI